ncbi:MAG: hypothetical protein JWQ38_2823 [Flavipsychrobacter sp.]|nr:hypothetical protein [Flavipsychrobacter sp.]
MQRSIKFLLIIILSCLCYNAHTQPSPLPEGFSFNMHADMDQYTKYVIPSVDWLQQTPLGVQPEERVKLNFFVLHWLERNPDIDISLPEYSLKFHGIDRDFLCLFLEGWIKYTLQTKDTVITNCSMAGLKSMLDFYESGKAAKLGKIDYLENLAHIDKEGHLRDLFDTNRNAKNTYLYLKPPHEKHNFRHDENYFGFHYYFINLVKPRAVTYRYMLEGYYNDWIETPDGSVTYPRLSPGNYNFRIQASMYPNFDHAVESSYAFNIAKPFWQENWFLLLAGLSAILLIYFIIKQREKGLKNIAQMDRMRIMFEYEHLKSQVNPHFLFNSFNTLTNLIAKDQKKAMDYTENLSSLYQNILTYHENDFVELSEEFSILNNYIAIQKGRFGDALQLKINIPGEILQTKKIVPLALQMLIENAIKHNVVSATSPLIIHITATNDEILIRNLVNLKLSKEKSAGLGLANIKRRYNLLTKKTISYGLHENEFVVTLPLL